MYCLYGVFDYIYIAKTHWHMRLNPFWPHKFGSKPLLGLESMAPIRPQLPASHANHSANETCMCVCVCMYVYMYVLMYVCIYVCVFVFVCVCVCMYVCVYIYIYMYACMYDLLTFLKSSGC